MIAICAIETNRTIMADSQHNLLKAEILPHEARYGSGAIRMVHERPPIEHAKFFMDPSTLQLHIVSTVPQANILRSRGFREMNSTYYFPNQQMPFRSGATIPTQV